MGTNSATNTIVVWIGQYQIPFMILWDRKGAQKFTCRFLFHMARRWVEQAEIIMAGLVKGE